jgi:ketosteroid isomerase-like protein
MRLRLLAAAAGLASGMAVGAFAQQTATPDPELRREILAFVQRFDPGFNNNDPGALASFFTDDAVLVVPEGLIYGRGAIAKYWADLLGKVRFSNHLTTLDQYSPHMIGLLGNEMWAVGEWSLTIEGPDIGVKGYWSGIVVREGDAWKFRLQAITPPPPPPAPAQTKIREAAEPLNQ